MRSDDNTGKFRLVDGVLSPAQKLQAVVIGEGIYSTHALPAAGNVRIGRLASSDIHIDEDSISRFHAVLHIGPPLTIEDLGSTNGVILAGEAIKPGRPVPINLGDPIKIGAVTMVVQAAKIPK